MEYIKLMWSIVFLPFFLNGCARLAWEEYKITQKPDATCMTGGASGYSVYTWNCLNGERVVVYQASSEMSRSKAQIEKTACGARTKFEKMIAKDPQHRVCRANPRHWNSDE